MFLTVGRLHVGVFRAAPQHHYVLRSIDAPEETPPSVEIVLARPPFTFDDELELMRSRGVDVLVSKNSGGEATRPKLLAARRLKLPVVLVRRPPVAAATVLYTVEDALGWLHGAASQLRGVST